MACAPGYYGSFCNITCPSGSYGVDCAGACSTCLHDHCHHVYGCLKNITDHTSTGIPAITATTTVESTSFTLGKILSRNEDINERNKSILNTYNLYSL
ncbi:uncharacterized protein LOC144625396 isoform X2 [Crassostrea virginica]